MRPRSVSLGIGCAIAIVATCVSIATLFAQPSGRDWPAVTREAKPWTRWWWQGSAVDPASLTANLQAIADSGMGGVEITPIYGVRGEERRFIPYLSEPWVKMLEHALSTAGRLDLGVDMATGTGWPFGGPSVGDDTAAHDMIHKIWNVEAGGTIAGPIRLVQTPLSAYRPRPGPLKYRTSRPRRRDAACLRSSTEISARRSSRSVVRRVRRATDLTSRVGPDGRLDWTAPQAAKVYGVFGGWHGKLVERAAPGGEGFVLDHFSPEAIRAYLAGFDRAFGPRPLAGLRAFFNDSYEVDDAPGQADWTPRLFDEFRRRRGYDLREHLPELFGDATDASADRVLADYRETVSGLPLETFTAEWGAWARRRAVVRNQGMDRRRTSSISTRRARSLKRRAPTCRASSGRRRPDTSRAGVSSPLKRRPGSTSISARRSRRCDRRSIICSSAA
jgi:hypothetical protein